jgi:hypothetical protein
MYYLLQTKVHFFAKNGVNAMKKRDINSGKTIGYRTTPSKRLSGLSKIDREPLYEAFFASSFGKEH